MIFENGNIKNIYKLTELYNMLIDLIKTTKNNVINTSLLKKKRPSEMLHHKNPLINTLQDLYNLIKIYKNLSVKSKTYKTPQVKVLKKSIKDGFIDLKMHLNNKKLFPKKDDTVNINSYYNYGYHDNYGYYTSYQDLEQYEKLFDTILSKVNILDIDSSHLNLSFKLENIKNKSYLVKDYLIKLEDYKGRQFDYRSFPNLIERANSIKNIQKILEPIKIDENKTLGVTFNILTPDLTSYKNIFSFSLFDMNKELKGGAQKLTPNKYIGKPKNIWLYINTLLDNLKYIINYNKIYNIIIYIDSSINNNLNFNRDCKQEFLRFCQKYSTRIQLIEVDMPLFKNGIKHFGTLGTLFRYLPLFHPQIENCFIGDVDNYNNPLLDLILNKFFIESNNNLLTFKPLYYARHNTENECVENFFAGMTAFKKLKKSIFNPEIWINMFHFLEKLYIDAKSDSIKDCDGIPNRIVGAEPFEYGSEEQAIANVLIPSILTAGREISNIYLTFLAPQLIKDIYINKILRPLILSLNEEFIFTLFNDLNLYCDSKLLQSDEFYDLLTSQANWHIFILILSVIYIKLLSKKHTYKNIDMFKDLNIKNKLGIYVFYILYPVYEMNIPNDIYNRILSKLLNDLKVDELSALNASHSLKLITA
jgi:uncharacterized protein YfkK (UPF0435 family)